MVHWPQPFARSGILQTDPARKSGRRVGSHTAGLVRGQCLLRHPRQVGEDLLRQGYDPEHHGACCSGRPANPRLAAHPRPGSCAIIRPPAERRACGLGWPPCPPKTIGRPPSQWTVGSGPCPAGARRAPRRQGARVGAVPLRAPPTAEFDQGQARDAVPDEPNRARREGAGDRRDRSLLPCVLADRAAGSLESGCLQSSSGSHSRGPNPRRQAISERMDSNHSASRRRRAASCLSARSTARVNNSPEPRPRSVRTNWGTRPRPAACPRTSVEARGRKACVTSKRSSLSMECIA